MLGKLKDKLNHITLLNEFDKILILKHRIKYQTDRHFFNENNVGYVTVHLYLI